MGGGRRRRRGAILVTVLWISALILWVGFQVSAETRLRSEEEVHALRRSQGFYLAMGGAAEALAAMTEAPRAEGLRPREGDRLRPDGKPRIFRYGKGEAVVVVEDEETKVNVNAAEGRTLRAVFERAGVPPEEAERLSDTVLDFIDADDIPRTKGAEKEAYARAGLAVRPFDGSLTSLDQMLLIPGITPGLFFGSGGGRTRLGKDGEPLPDPAFPGADSLFQSLTVYGNNSELKPVPEGERPPPVFRPQGTYRILSCGRAAAGPPAVVLWLVVRLSPASRLGYDVLYRKIL